MISDQPAVNISANTTYVQTVLGLPTQGDAINSRTGFKILLRNWTVKGWFLQTPTNVVDVAPTVFTYPVDSVMLVQMILVWDKQWKNGLAAPSWTDIYETDDMPFDYREISHRGRYRILRRKNLRLAPGPWPKMSVIPFRLSLRCRWPIRYVGGGGDAQDTGIFMMYRIWEMGSQGFQQIQIRYRHLLVWNNCQ